MNTVAGTGVPLDLYFEVQTFLFREARYLDDEQFRPWLALLTEDIHYWLPIRENRFRKDRRPPPTPADSASVYNDDLSDLTDRVARFETGFAWVEDPPSRIRRLVTNIEAETTARDDELAVYSNILLYRNRRQDEEAWFVAARRDRLRWVDGTWRLAKRHIVFDQHVILDDNLSVFL
ncbi:MAG: 3-phenylpropionate/cinnamic acid dioxygenase subunit beta [Gammaproteobacteria bacterium]|nr:3-phenylpropionate/cinnamic acid dioxygenase subunit beta [Gammaproteobacteria bacterium]